MLKYITPYNYKKFFQYLSEEQKTFINCRKHDICNLVKKDFEFVDRDILDSLREMFISMKYKKYTFNDDSLDIDAFLEWMKEHQDVAVMCMNESMGTSDNFGMVADTAMHFFYTDYFHEVIADSMFVAIVQNMMESHHKINFN